MVHVSFFDLIFFSFLLTHWTLATLISIFCKHTKSAPTSGDSDLLFPLFVIFFLQTSAWVNSSLSSYLCLDVTFVEASPNHLSFTLPQDLHSFSIPLLDTLFTFMCSFIYCSLSVFPNRRYEGRGYILSPVIALLLKIVPKTSRCSMNIYQMNEWMKLKVSY